MLGRLYGLYRTVIDTIRGYGDYLWSNVVSQVLARVPAGLNRFQSIARLRRAIAGPVLSLRFSLALQRVGKRWEGSVEAEMNRA